MACSTAHHHICDHLPIIFRHPCVRRIIIGVHWCTPCQEQLGTTNQRECVGLGMWHVWARRKTRMFHCLSTSVYKTALAFPDSRTKEDAKRKIAARARRQNAGTGGWTPWKQRGGSQVRTAHWTVGRDLGQQIQHAYRLCRESKFYAHYSGRWKLTQWHHKQFTDNTGFILMASNFSHSSSEGRCSYSVSTTTKVFIKQDSGRERIYTGRFSYLPARDKRGSPSWLYHRTLSQLAEDNRQRTREFAWFLHESAAPHFSNFVRKSWLTNHGRPTMWPARLPDLTQYLHLIHKHWVSSGI